MKIVVLSIALFLGSFNSVALAQNNNKANEKTKSQTYQIVGKFVKPSKDLKLPYKYYFVFSNSKGQKMAFPLVNKSSLDMKKLDIAQTYHINVKDSENLVTVGESTKKVKVLEMVEGKVFNMKDLSYTANQISNQTPKPNIPDGQTPHHPMFRINDNVANTAIFTAGAILLGSILLGK